MKAFARMYFWWPKLDEAIDAIDCSRCAEYRNEPPSMPLLPWPFPSAPWSRLHIDHAGPFHGQLYLIVVDAHSKWLEIVPVSSTSSQVTVNALRRIFITHGLPRTIVSDNATTFTGDVFQVFCKENGIRHLTTAPYHPATNGLAERAVQTFKNAMKKMIADGKRDHLLNLQKFLFTYRNTPHPTTSRTPSELLMGRRVRTKFDLLRPCVATPALKAQAAQKAAHDVHVRDAHLSEGQQVLARDFTAASSKWQPGKLVNQRLASFDVELADGGVVRRHAEQLIPATPHPPAAAELPAPDVTSDTASPTPQPSPAKAVPSATATATSSHPTVEPDFQPLRRSQRIRQPPQRLTYS